MVQPSVRIDVKWHNKKFPVEFSNQAELDATTVKQLKEYCQRMTGLETKEMKLSVFGAVMNNDSMPLNVYGIRPGCYVSLKQKKQHKKIHHDETPHKSTTLNHQQKSSPLLDNLNTIQAKIKEELTPQVKDYEKSVKAFLNQSEKPEKEHKKQVYTGAYLGEQLMHILFDLDGISCGQDVVARQARKDAVNAAQALLDKVDELKSLVKNV